MAVPTVAADTPLVDLLPVELGGALTQKSTIDGPNQSGVDPSAAMIFESVRQLLGVDEADMTIGIATNGSASVIAIRVAGASALQIIDAVISTRTPNATTSKVDLEPAANRCSR